MIFLLIVFVNMYVEVLQYDKINYIMLQGTQYLQLSSISYLSNFIFNFILYLMLPLKYRRTKNIYLKVTGKQIPIYGGFNKFSK